MSIVGSQTNTFGYNGWFVNPIFGVTTNYIINGVDLGNFFVPPYVLFTTSNPLVTIPPNVTYMNIISIGGGGGGGGGGAASNYTGSSGGSGAAGSIGVNLFLPKISNVNTYSVTVGAGGSFGQKSGQNGISGYDGGIGGTSYITYNSANYCKGNGGNFGKGGYTTTSSTNLNNGGAETQKANNCTVNTVSYDYNGPAGNNGGNNTDSSILEGKSVLENLLNQATFTSQVSDIFSKGNGGYGGAGDNTSSGAAAGLPGDVGAMGCVIVFYYYTPYPTNYTIVNTAQA